MAVIPVLSKKRSVIKRQILVLICGLLLLIGISSCGSVKNQVNSPEATQDHTISAHPTDDTDLTQTSSKYARVTPTLEYKTALPPTSMPTVAEINPTNTLVLASSPPLGYILFSVFGQNNDGIYIVNANGENLRKLTKEMGLYENPLASPDGKWIYFQSDVDNPHGVFDIFRIDVDGHRSLRLTNEKMTGNGISISPDGSKIVFVGQKAVPSNNNFDIFMVNNTGVIVKQLTSNHIWKRNPTWSPDGKKIAYIISEKGVDYGNLYVINLQDGTTTSLTTDNQIWGLSRITWSPDSTHLAMIRYSNQGKSIYLVNADGTDLMRVSRGAADYDPIWSPDGTKIAYVSDENNESVFYLYHLDSSAQDILARQPKSGEFMSPVWSPDGRYISYVSGDEINGTYIDSLYVIEMSSRKIHQVASNLGGINTLKWILPVFLQSGRLYQLTPAGEGVKLHTSANLSSQVLKKLHSGDQINIIEGPVQSDNYFWWKIQAVSDNNIGWIADSWEWYKPNPE